MKLALWVFFNEENARKAIAEFKKNNSVQIKEYYIEELYSDFAEVFKT